MKRIVVNLILWSLIGVWSLIMMIYHTAIEQPWLWILDGALTIASASLVICDIHDGIKLKKKQKAAQDDQHKESN